MSVKSCCFALLSAISLASPGLRAETHCPQGISGIPYRPLGLSQIGVQVTINDRGPFEFILDTGAQITVLDSKLAEELNLHSEGSIGVVSVVRYARTDLVSLDSISLDRFRLGSVQVALQSLQSMRSLNPEIRGILGVDFLRRFDLLIDNTHRVVCLDDSHRMQFAILGDRVAVVNRRTANDSTLDVSPVLIPVHLAGGRHQDTILRIDSGSSAPVLFSNKVEMLPWLQKVHASRGSISGARNRVLLAAVPEQSVRIADHVERRISFLTPIDDGSPVTKKLEDGLLPTALFKEVLISFRDGFVIFNPHDACPPSDTN